MNPYETPVDDRPGLYDRSLMKRIAFAFLLVAVWFAALSAMYSWQYMVDGGRLDGLTIWDKLQMLFMDWNWRPDV